MWLNFSFKNFSMLRRICFCITEKDLSNDTKSDDEEICTAVFAPKPSALLFLIIGVLRKRCVCVCIYIHIHIYICIYIYMYIYICIYMGGVCVCAAYNQ